ncbi:MAG: hypothetical protein VKJ86_04065 [Synechococcus sp.]|nr:hypothetical protein [Synechococcus sp.]
MAHWEFLLQKKGDRRWENPKTDSLQLTPGEYRLAGKGAPQVEIHCEITAPQGRSSQPKTTNPKGLLALMPFRQLTPGQWVFTCRSLDAINPWEKRLTLQIRPATQGFRPLPLPPNPNVFSFETDLSLPEPQPASQDAPEHLLQTSLAELDELLKAELAPIWAEMDQEAPLPTVAPDIAFLAAQDSPYRLQLGQTVYGWHKSEPVTLQGEIQRKPAPQSPTVATAQLIITLRDPQTAAVVGQQTQAIALKSLPQSFHQTLALTDVPDTLILLGEVCLQAPTGATLATQTFNLVADYRAIATVLEPPSPGPEMTPEKAPIPTKPLKLPTPDPKAVLPQAPTSPTPSPTVLPPRLKSQGQKTATGLVLPHFPKDTPTPDPEAIAPEAEIKIDSPPEPTDQFEAITEEIPTPEDLEPIDSPASQAESDPTADLDWNSRFFTRLNALAADSNDSTWLTETPEPGVPDTPAAMADDMSPREAPEEAILSEPESELLTSTEPPKPPVRLEIVVDSPWDEAPTIIPEAPEPELSTSEPEPPEPTPETTPLPVHEPEPIIIPEPEITLDKTEYRVGELAVVQVTLPQGGDRFEVKLWLQDRQSRELLAGPFQLINTNPDPQGVPQYQQRVSVPPGVLTVRFEAIAIEPQSQQESRKVGIDCSVLPEVGAPDIDWDELDADSWSGLGRDIF